MIAIIGAMPEEVNAFLVHCSQVNQKQWNDFIYYEAKLEDHEVVVALSGVGKVNAAFTTTFLIMKFQPTYIINVGCAGGLNPSFNETDLVIGTSVEMHDLDILKGYSQDPRFISQTSATLIEAAKNIMNEMEIVYHEGLIVSGDQFVHRPEQVEEIRAHFPLAVAVEMESYSVGKVCEKMNVPCIILRSLSDIVTKENNYDTFESFVLEASRVSAKVTTELIKANPI